MTPDEVDGILREWVGSWDSTLEPELQAVCTALFLEETFGITLLDAQIVPTELGTLEGMRSVLARSSGEA